MKPNDRAPFAALIAGIYAYHRTPISDAIIGVWWNGCQGWSLEEVTKALNILTHDAEAGKFVPKIGDITRVLQGTTTEKAALAWGKVLGAMSAVGAYSDVVFDDPAIHAAITDCGGWMKVCRGDLKELSFLQHRFSQSYKAYTERGSFEYPRMLGGDRSPDAEYIKFGRPLPKPAIVGDPARAAKVLEAGGTGGPQITFTTVAKLLAPMQREAA